MLILQKTTNDDEENYTVPVPTTAKPLQVAVVGRPNAGKSTLINQILGEERLLTGPEAGITRDAISLRMEWGGVPMRIFDTAGMRKKGQSSGEAGEAFRLGRAASGEIRRGRCCSAGC